MQGSNIVIDFMCTSETLQKSTEICHYIVKFMDYEGKVVRVTKDLRDISAEEIASMYKEC